MTEARKRSVLATMVFVGSMLGAGVFGLPYVFAQAGWLLGFAWLVVIGLFILLLQLINAEMTIHTAGRRRLAGLAGYYLGPFGRYAATILFFGLGWGVLVAYIILGGEFLGDIFAGAFGGSPFTYGFIFLAIEALLVSLSLKRAAHFELIIGGLLLMLFIVLILSGAPFINFSNLSTLSPSNALVPYGVVLFAVSGLGLAPEVHDIFGEKYEYRMHKSVIHGFMIVATLYALFTAVVVGVTGAATTENALDGYAALLGPGMSVFGALIGLITIGSIFMMVGEQLKDTFIHDFFLPKSVSLFATLSVPAILFILGVRDFISVIEFTGAVFTALLASVMILAYEKMRKTIPKNSKALIMPRFVCWTITAVFVVGAIYEIINRFVI